ncbi:MAG TPA: hypothetical protein PLJ78_17035 [Anaerolineae bacterium]|nr:hypothetical protein [Anaerolineae bacterium]HQK15637.1 hypothetical protein [Anaerolineae bacterium]
MKRTAILVAVLLLLLLTGRALAMSSANYRLDWFTPLTGGGGGPMQSPNYAVNFTVGQSAVGTSAGTNYGGCLGYWCGITGAVGAHYRIYLPLVLRNS